MTKKKRNNNNKNISRDIVRKRCFSKHRGFESVKARDIERLEEEEITWVIALYQKQVLKQINKMKIKEKQHMIKIQNLKHKRKENKNNNNSNSNKL